MNSLFSSALDSDGDYAEVDVSRDLPGTLIFSTYYAYRQTWNSARITRVDVTRLYNALGQWLGEDPTLEQPAPPAPLTAADVRAIASEVVAEALAQRGALDISNGVSFCRIPGCMLFPGTAEHFEHDPEPRDVGHPGPVTLAQALADPTPASMDMLWGQPPQVEVHRVECGLCKAPWSDGHGQPGDPCTGAPKQLVGCECGHRWGVHGETGCVGNLASCTCERTPPVETECECGHRWGVHVAQGCSADNWDCECTRTSPVEPTCECGHRTALHDSRGCPSRQVGMPHKPCPCTVTR
jgi:hypothetical protein